LLGEPGGDRCEPGIHDVGVVVVDFVERRVFNRADLGGGLVEKAAAAAAEVQDDHLCVGGMSTALEEVSLDQLVHEGVHRLGGHGRQPGQFCRGHLGCGVKGAERPVLRHRQLVGREGVGERMPERLVGEAEPESEVVRGATRRRRVAFFGHSVKVSGRLIESYIRQADTQVAALVHLTCDERTP